jgi:16S rRNA (guanine966-N2)-methyltransferase
VRIIGGSLKGRQIDPPSNLKARPTTDYARESLFNILNNRYSFEGKSVLDLFSGTGAISYEFASRGVDDIDVVEIDPRHCSFIRTMAKQFGFNDIKVHHITVTTWLEVCTKKYDIIFADPPYDLKWLEELPKMVMTSGSVTDETLFILEHPKRVRFSENEWFREHRFYGNVNFSFFCKTR